MIKTHTTHLKKLESATAFKGYEDLSIPEEKAQYDAVVRSAEFDYYQACFTDICDLLAEHKVAPTIRARLADDIVTYFKDRP